MKVYLAGKITGDPNYREKFAEAAKKLEERAGVTVLCWRGSACCS